MSTRSRIGYMLPDGTVKSVYCHSDGYIEGPHGVGWMLHTHYNSLDAAKNIVALGDLSSLLPMLAPPDGVKHTFGNPAKDVTKAYSRDRGTPDTDAAVSHSDGAFFEAGEEYNYLFRHGMWVVQSQYGRAETLRVPVDLALALITGRITS